MGIFQLITYSKFDLKKNFFFYRLVEINGKLLITRSPSRDDLTRLLSACPDPAQLVVLRGAEPSGGNGRTPSTTNGPHAVAEVSALRSELGIVRERAEEAQRAKDGLRADNLRLTHRISYLEEQVYTFIYHLI